MSTVVVGDIHAKFRWFNRFLNKRKPDVVISTGDFGYWPREIDMSIIKNHDTKIYFCDGNHEDHSWLRQLTDVQKPVEILDNIFYMPRGTTLEHEGQTFLFVGGALSIDKELRIRGDDWFEEELLTDDDYNNLPNVPVDVVISHTAPNSVIKNSNLCGFRGEKYFDPSTYILDEVLKKYNPKVWYFGHFHKKYNSIVNNCQFYGLNEIPNDGWWRLLLSKSLDDYEDCC